MSTPALRFKDEDGLEFPVWETKTLKEMCNKVMDGTHFSPKTKSGPKKYLTSKNIRNSRIDLSECSYISEDEHQEIFRKCPVKVGDILLTKDGANTGNCCINNLNEEFSLLSSVAVIDGRTSELNNSFLLQVLQSELGINAIKNAMAGQAISRITLEKINKFCFNFPSLAEQTKIANFLTAVDEKIAQLTQKQELLTQYKKGVMQKIFSQELRFKDDDGNEFPEWEEKEVGDVFKVTRGNVLAMSLVSEAKTDRHQYPVYSSQTKNNGLTGYFNEYLYESSITWTTDGANAGDVNFRAGKFYCTNVCGVLINKDGHANACIAAMINAVSRKYVSYVGNPKLMNGVMAKIAIRFPCVEEQNKVANFLATVDKKITNTQAELEAVKQYKQGLLQKMFV